MKDSLYEENFKLHSENARLRKKLEQLESSLGIDRLRAHFEAVITIQKRMRKIALSEFSFCMALNSCKYL